MRAIHRQVVIGLLAAFVLWPCAAASGQSLSDRIKHYHKSKRAQDDAKAKNEQARLRSVQRRLRTAIGPVKLEDVPAREAFDWWSKTTGVQLVMNWKSMENDGIDPETPIRLKLRRANATTVLQMLMEQTAVETEPLIYEVKPWFVQVMTRVAALRNPVTRVYYIGDLLIDVPNFTNAPTLGVSGSLGGDDDDDDDDDSRDDDDDDDDDSGDQRLSKTDRAEDIAQLIRDTIEPDIWEANGGQYASIRYFQQRLVVRAPMFVQRQIGNATGTGTATRTRTATARTRGGVVRRPAPPGEAQRLPHRSSKKGASGVESGKSVSVSGVQDKE